ncbi:MAG TPA: MFS transporter [Vicinamibacteria bacterium]|nr:MFS transporter [Vicinamibacteria bacterium]
MEAAAPARALPGFLSAFGFRGYRVLWTGAFLSSVGTWTQDVALNWLIHERFLDPRYLGYRSFAADAPLIAFMVLGGAAADRIDRRRILIASQVLQMSFAAALGLLYGAGRLSVFPIVLFAFLTGLAQSQSAPTYQAVLTTLVPPAQIPSAVALNSLQFNLSRTIGPVLAGILLVQAGAGWCFTVNVLSFLAVIVALRGIEIPSPGLARKEKLAATLLAGFRHVGRDPQLRLYMALAGAGSFLAFPLITYLPVIAGDVLRTGARGYSQLLAAFGCGAILGALVTAHRGAAPARGRALLAGFAAYGLATLAAVLAASQLVAMALLFVSGVSLVTSFSILNSLVQESAPQEFRGRVVGIYGLCFRGGMPLGSLAAGFFVRAFGAPYTLASLSALLSLLAAGVALRSRRIHAT